MSTPPQPVEVTAPTARAEWSGYLTAACAPAVLTRLTELLDGKTATVVYSNADSWEYQPPAVRPSQRITVKPVTGPFSGVHITEPGWSHTITTDAADQAAARSRPHAADRPPHLKITHDRVEITDHAPARNKYYVVIALEYRDNETESRRGDGLFWADLRENLKDPEFRKTYMEFSREIAAPAASGIGVHIGHCCSEHGCKYGDDDTCPVVTGEHPQSFPCEECSDASDNENGSETQQ